MTDFVTAPFLTCSGEDAIVFLLVGAFAGVLLSAVVLILARIIRR